MMDDDMGMDLDLNQQPSDPPSGSPLGLVSLLNDLETAHTRIEERIRHLEAVTARALQRHRRRQARTTIDTSGNVDSEMQVQNSDSVLDVAERTVERGCKRDSSHLVAKALEMDLVVNKVDDDGGSFFDCNICLDMAKEPILTCCGHLYCWPCFYQLPYVDSTTKECPVCKGEVADGNVTPVYGNGDGESITELESGLKIPPRPKARRVESVRQQRVTRGLSHIPVAEALRRIRTSIGLGHQAQRQDAGGVNLNFVRSSHVLQTADTLSSRRLRSRLISRVLSEGAASLSSELDNAQRMFEDLAASLTDRLLQRSNGDAVHGATDDGDSFRRDAAFIQSDIRTLDAVAGTSSATSIPSSSQANEVSDTVVQLENLTTDTRNLPVGRSSLASRRRSILSRLSDVDSALFREPRRRRLN
ncbi:uncharacterized protein LOC107778029 [Nicotiana tabacum]|uniref:E3 ubiquitin-protein ligase RMA n=3 Tax=Nicotiana TaxID=4085 RepID=A0A1S3YN58_TOBAC|nr:PREDICTED: uncharacterized protein LOC104212779 [Nicotiana sylvestris]XP_016453699.1 PREDICTED: uncharacterized protein LOC107778029 [Nicotiana tabacum]